MSVDFFEEVGVDVGEHYQADAFDADNDVFVFFDALHVAFEAFVYAAGDADVFVLFEILFVEYLAAGCVVCGDEPQQIDRFLRYYLN